MTDTDSLQFFLDKEYVAEEFEAIFSPKDDMDRNLTPTKSQALGLLLLATLPKEYQQLTQAQVSLRRDGLLVTVTRS